MSVYLFFVYKIVYVVIKYNINLSHLMDMDLEIDTKQVCVND